MVELGSLPYGIPTVPIGVWSGNAETLRSGTFTGNKKISLLSRHLLEGFKHFQTELESEKSLYLPEMG